MIALHDISNVNCPGIARVWEDVKSMVLFHCYEFTDQYEGRGHTWVLAWPKKRVVLIVG